MIYIKVFSRLILEIVRLRLKNRQKFDNALFLRALYKASLRREPDEDGLTYYLNKLQTKRLTKRDVFFGIVNSVEFRLLHVLRVDAGDVQHQARQKLVQEHLPPAQVILDLGGASVNYPEGALLAMNYPHHPEKIMIVDLPPQQRMEKGKGAESKRTYVTENGTQIQYFYQSMVDLSSFADQSVDLVWSGQSIEHISETEGDHVCQEMHRILKPNGFFCLDTPNAALTRLQSPHKFIHPEHQVEYYVPQLRGKLEKWGFQISSLVLGTAIFIC